MVRRHKVMPDGVTDGKAVSTAFFAGQASMVILSTGSLSFIRENMQGKYGVAFVPRNLRNAVAIGGASLMMPKGLPDDQQKASWTLIKWLTSKKKPAEALKAAQVKADQVMRRYVEQTALNLPN
jgi:sn-glycerol 3-phosphate transport system substrate-binding protein